jgi:hypothetical protein
MKMLRALLCLLSIAASSPLRAEQADSEKPAPPLEPVRVGRPERIEVLPAEVKMNTPLNKVQLVVTGFYADGTVQDLTQDFLLREIDLMRVKGKARPVAVYESLGYHTAQSFPALREMLEAFQAGLVAYRERDFARAVECFSIAAATSEKEKPARLYLERCRHYQTSPPPADWDGVWVLTEK